MFCWLCYVPRNVDMMYDAVQVCSGCRKEINRVVNFLRMYRTNPFIDTPEMPPVDGAEIDGEAPVPAKP